MEDGVSAEPPRRRTGTNAQTGLARYRTDLPSKRPKITCFCVEIGRYSRSSALLRPSFSSCEHAAHDPFLKCIWWSSCGTSQTVVLAEDSRALCPCARFSGGQLVERSPGHAIRNSSDARHPNRVYDALGYTVEMAGQRVWDIIDSRRGPYCSGPEAVRVWLLGGFRGRGGRLARRAVPRDEAARGLGSPAGGRMPYSTSCGWVDGPRSGCAAEASSEDPSRGRPTRRKGSRRIGYGGSGYVSCGG